MVLTCQKPIQADRLGEVREGLPGSTLERGMRVEKVSRTWEALVVPPLLEDVRDATQGIRLVSPTNGETQKQGRPEPKRRDRHTQLDRGGRSCPTKRRVADDPRESDQPMVLRDGRADHMGKGLTEIRSRQR